jgi:TldD protein
MKETHLTQVRDAILPFFRKMETETEYLEVRIENLSKLTIVGNIETINRHGDCITSLHDMKGGYARSFSQGEWSVSIFDSIEESTIEKAIAKVISNKTIECNKDTVNSSNPQPHRRNELSDFQEFRTLAGSLIDQGTQILSMPNVVTNYINSIYLVKDKSFINSRGKVISDHGRTLIYNFHPAVKYNDRQIHLQKSYCCVGKDSHFDLNREFSPDTILGFFANDNLSLKNMPPGKYEAILDPQTTGALIHELLGHLLEADLLYDYPSYLENKVAIGKRISVDQLSVIDDPTLEERAGSYTYDDEGNRAKKVHLVTNGEITEMLHMMDTAWHMKHQTNGHGRSIDYRFLPYVRMSNTYIEPRGVAFDDMVGSIKTGVYLKNCTLAKNDLKRFQLYPQEAYLIEHGKVKDCLAPPIVYGDILDLLENINGIGNDIEFYDTGCTKGYSDAWMPVSLGGVHLHVKSINIGQSFL